MTRLVCECVLAMCLATSWSPAAFAAGTPATPVAAAPASAGPATPTTDAQFFAELGYKDVATAADAARALAIFASEGAETGADFEAAKVYLTKRGILPDGWLDRASADSPLTKGNLARLICRTVPIKGGLWMRLLGPLPRLALNECVYLELMTAGCQWQHVSGGELVGVIDRADRFRARESGLPEVKPLQDQPSQTQAEVKK